MRERIVNVVIILIVLALGVTGTLYFVNSGSDNEVIV